MQWLYSRLPTLVSLFACLVFLSGLQPAQVRPTQVGAAESAPQEAGLKFPTVAVAVSGCEAEATLPAPVRVQLYRWSDDRYPLFGVKEISLPGLATFDVPIGGYWLVVRAPGCARHTEWVSVAGHSERNLDVELQLAESVRVLVRNEDKVPIAGARVFGWGEGPVAHGGRTERNGIVRLRSLSRDVDRLVISAVGYESLEVPREGANIDVVLRQLGSIEVTVLDAKSQPVPGATVRIAGFSFWPPREVLTNPQGIALIRGLERGSYDLLAYAEEQVSPVRLGVALGKGQERNLALNLEPGRFVSILVEDGGRAGEPPIADAEVVLVEDGLGPFPLQGRSDESGRVELGPIPFRTAVVNVRANGFVARSGLRVPNGANPSVRVELLRGGALTGVVVNSRGEPVAGVRLEVVGNDVFGRPIAARAGAVAVRRGFFERALPGTLPIAAIGELGVVTGALPTPAGRIVPGSQSAPWVTDALGRFRLEDVPSGRLRVLARHPDYVETLSRAISLDPGGQAQVRVVLPLGAALNGRVLEASGAPIEGARVDVVSQRGTDTQTAFTDESGAFEFLGVAERVDLMVARPEEPHRFVLESPALLNPGSTRAVILTLPGTREVCEIEVTGPNGEVVDDARVTLLSLDPGVPLRQSLYVDGAGRVSFEDTVGLSAHVRVRSLRFRPYEVRFNALPESLQIEMALGGVLSGEVTHVRGRLGLVGAKVEWLQQGNHQQVLTDETGSFQFRDIGVGAVELKISKAGYAPHSEVIHVRPEQLEQLEIQIAGINLLESGSAEGVVVDSGGRPVSNARVGQGLIPAFLPVASQPDGFVQTDVQGRFELSDLSPGTVRLSAYAVDVGRGSRDEVPIEQGRVTRDVTIVLGGHHPDTEPGSLGNVALTLGERGGSQGVEVVVVHIAAGSEADSAGLSTGDVLVAIDGVRPPSMAAARAQLAGPEGSDVVVEVLREGQRLSVRIRREAVRR